MESLNSMKAQPQNHHKPVRQGRARTNSPRTKKLSEKWYPPHGETMHNNKRCPDRVRNFKNAVLEMHLLSQCKTIFGTPLLHKGKPSMSSFRLVAEVLPGSKSDNFIIV